jgi:hypothetical protein
MPALILMYHDLADDLEGVTPKHRPYVLDTSVFRYQLAAVVASGLPALTSIS